MASDCTISLTRLDYVCVTILEVSVIVLEHCGQ